MTRPLLRAWWTRVMVSLTYGRESADEIGPLLQADYCRGDAIAEARFLCRAGYGVAAIATARADLERRLRRAVLLSTRWSDCRRKTRVPDMVRFLTGEELLGVERGRALERSYERMSKVVHGRECDRRRTRVMIDECEVVNAELLAITGRLAKR